MSAATLPEAERRAYQANVPRFFAYSVVGSFQLWFPIWIIYLQEQRGLSLAEIGFLDAPFFLTQVLAEVPTGALADRYGRKLSLFLGSALVTLAIFVFGIADNYPLILISYVAWGIGMGLQSGADQAFLYDSLKLLGRESEYSRMFGRLNASILAANIVAGLIGAPLAAQTSLATPVLVSAVITAVSTVMVMGFREPAVHEARLPYLQTLAAGVSEVRGRPVLRLVMLFGILGSMAFFVAQYFMQPFLKGHGASTASLGLLVMPVRLVSIGASVVAHRLEERLGTWTALALTPVVSLTACAGLALWDSIYSFTLIPLVAAAGTTRMLLVSHYINSRISSERRATIVSLYALAAAMASSICAPLYGYIADERSLQFLYGVVTVFGVCTMPLLLLAWRRAEQREARLQL